LIILVLHLLEIAFWVLSVAAAGPSILLEFNPCPSLSP
jgi:hypothetical protein